MKLSILICSIETRLASFSILIKELTRQARYFPKQVEVLALVDDCGLSVGAKRNHLIHCASGDYVAFVDDDDEVDREYISLLIKATESKADVLAITSLVYFNQAPPKLCNFSTRFSDEGEDNDHYWRWPNHLCAIRRDIVLRHPFQPISFGEDSAFARSILNELKTEQRVSCKPIYFYRYSSLHTATQRPELRSA